MALTGNPINTNAKMVFAKSLEYLKSQPIEGKPFAGYSDFDECVSQNRDKGDPKAYCAEVMRRTEGKSFSSDDDITRRKIMEEKKTNGETEQKEEAKTTPKAEVKSFETNLKAIKDRLTAIEEKLNTKAEEDEDEEPDVNDLNAVKSQIEEIKNLILKPLKN